MTRIEALNEAWRRWGSMSPRTLTFASRRRTIGRKYEVSARVEGTWQQVAFGASDESWEAAFADADHRTPPTPTPGGET